MVRRILFVLLLAGCHVMESKAAAWLPPVQDEMQSPAVKYEFVDNIKHIITGSGFKCYAPHAIYFWAPGWVVVCAHMNDADTTVYDLKPIGSHWVATVRN